MKFRKKPVEIEAMQMPVSSQRDVRSVAEWMIDQGYPSADLDPAEADDMYVYGEKILPEYGSNFLEIETLEGTMTARPGDWIIRGVQGEFYPCKPDIFEQTYEPVAAAEATR